MQHKIKNINKAADYLPWFHDFVQGFMGGDVADQNNIRIKKEHSLRVWELARRLTASLNLDPTLAEYAQTAALFHDLGRFPQYAQYKTFNDRLSANHAQLSLRVIRETGVLAGLATAAQRLIQAAVLLHNRRFLPPKLRVEITLLTNIVRDADKLDIFQVMLSQFDPASPPNGVVSLGLTPHPTNFTEKILDQIQSRQLASYDDMIWINDFKLLLCGWVYDLNFGESHRVMRERCYIPRLLEYLPPDSRIEALGKELQEYQASRLR